MTTKSVKLRIDGDYAAALRGLESFSGKLHDVTDGAKVDLKLDNLDDTKAGLDGISDKLKDLKGANLSLHLIDTDELKENLDSIKAQIKDVTDRGGIVRVSLEGAGTTKEDLAAVKMEMDELSDSGARVSSSVKEAGEETEGFGSKFKNMLGMAASTVGFLGVAVGIKDAMSQAGNFEAGLTTLVTGAGEAEKNLGMVGQGIKSIAIDTGTSTQELISGMYMIESAGFHGAAGLDVLRAAAEGAKVGDADLASVSNAVTSALNAYHLKGSDAVNVTNQLIATVASGKMHMEDLAKAIGNVLPVAAAAHISLAQVGGAMATMTMQGMSTRRASQNLANAIRSLEAPGAAAGNEMRDLGLNANAVSNNLGKVGLTGTIQDLTEAILTHTRGGAVLASTYDNLTPKAKSLATAILSQTISSKDLTTAEGALSPQQAELVKQFATSASSATGMKQTFTGAMKAMMGGATGLQVALLLGGKNMSTFKANVDAVGSAGAKTGAQVNGWALVQADFNTKMDRFKEVLQVATITLGQMLLPVLTKAMDIFLAIPAPVWMTVGAITAVIGTYFGIMKLIEAVKAFGVAMETAAMTNPWLILAVAIAVVAVLIITHWKDISHWATVCFSGIESLAMSVINWIKQNWPLLVAILVGPIGIAALEIYKHWADITAWTIGLWHSVVGIFTELGHDIESVWDNCFNYITGSFSRFYAMEVAGWDQFWSNLKNTTSDATHWIGNTVETFWNNLIGNAKMAWTTMVSDISGAWDHVENAVAAPVRWIANNIWNKFAGVVDAVTSFLSMGRPIPTLSLSKGGHLSGYGGGDILPALLEPGETVVSKEASKSLAPHFAAAGVPGYSTGGIIGGIGNIVGDVSHDVSSAVSSVAGFAKSLVMGATEDAAKPVLNGILSAMGGMPGANSGYGKMLQGIPKMLIPKLLSWMGGKDASMGSGNSIISYAESFIGKVPYVWGGSSPAGWDCSGFTSYVYDHFGYHPPRTSESQWDWVKRTTAPVPGGLAFFSGSDGTASSPGHVGIIVNSNKMVDAYGTGLGTRFNTIQGSSGTVSGFGIPPTGFSTALSAGVTGGVMSPSQIAALWVQMGGPAYAANNMARIADAESGDDPSIVQKGEPPGLTGWGLYQITPTSGINQNGAFGNLLNASNNTRAAISLFNAAGGYGPWTSDPVGSSLVAGGLSYANGGLINEHVVGFGLSSGRPYQFGEAGAEVVTPLSASGSGSSYGGVSGSGNTYIVINANECVDPDSTAAAIHQKLRRYKTKKGNQPLGLS